MANEVREKIESLLMKGVDRIKLRSEIAMSFFELIEREGEEKLKDPFSGETLDDFYYAVDYQYDLVEDSVKAMLMEPSYQAKIKKDMKEAGISVFSPLSGDRLSEDSIEEFYADLFLAFDRQKQELFEEISSAEPCALYEEGKNARAAYRAAHGLLFDELDFVRSLEDHLNEDLLEEIMARKVYESVTYHQRYELIGLEEEEEGEADGEGEDALWEREETLEADAASSYHPEEEGILIPAGDFDLGSFSYVYELFEEYNGKRILPSDNEWTEQAYFETYGHEFAELLAEFVLQLVEQTARDIAARNPLSYASLAHFYHWSEEERLDPIVILDTSDKIGYSVMELQERLWNQLGERPFLPMYEKGKELCMTSSL